MRLRRSSLLGTIDVALDDTEGGISSPEFSDLPDVAAPDYLPIILDPAKLGGEPEIVWVTAHVGGETTLTALRGQEQNHGSSPGREHEVGIAWSHGPTAGEFRQDYEGHVHDVAATAIPLSNLVALTLDADVEALTTNTDITEATLILMQGAGGEWVSNTGISIVWTATPPTLTTTPTNFDVIRLIRLTPDGSIWIGEIVASDLSLP